MKQKIIVINIKKKISSKSHGDSDIKFLKFRIWLIGIIARFWNFAYVKKINF